MIFHSRKSFRPFVCAIWAASVHNVDDDVAGVRNLSMSNARLLRDASWIEVGTARCNFDDANFPVASWWKCFDEGQRGYNSLYFLKEW